MAPSDNLFYTGATFLMHAKKNAKHENKLCPLSYEEALEAVQTEDWWNLEKLRYPRKAALVAQSKTWVKFICHKNENPSFFFLLS